MGRIALIFALGVLSCSLYGQQRYDEVEIQVQDKYIKANQYKLLAKFDKALELYQELLVETPLNPSIHHDMARIYLAQEDYGKATTSAKKATDYNPSNTWYLMTRAEILDEAKDYSQSAQVLSTLAKKTEDQDVYRRWAAAWDKAKDWDKALYVSQLAQSKFGASLYWLDVDIDAHLKKEDVAKGIKRLEKYISNNPQSEEGYIRLVDLYVLKGDKRKSKEILNKIITLNPDNTEASYKLAVLDSQGNTQDDIVTTIDDARLDIDYKIKAMIPHIESAIADRNVEHLNTLLGYGDKIKEQYPDEAKSHALVGDLLINLNRFDEAIASYERSISLDKSIYDIWDQLMVAKLSLGSFESLKEWSSKAMDFYPNQSGPYCYHAIALYEMGNLSESREYIDEAEFIGINDSFQAESLNLLKARIEYTDGNKMVAIELLMQYINLSSVTFRSYEVLGDLHAQSGDKELALKFWNTAIEKGADKARIAQKLQSI